MLPLVLLSLLAGFGAAPPLGIRVTGLGRADAEAAPILVIFDLPSVHGILVPTLGLVAIECVAFPPLKAWPIVEATF